MSLWWGPCQFPQQRCIRSCRIEDVSSDESMIRAVNFQQSPLDTSNKDFTLSGGREAVAAFSAAMLTSASRRNSASDNLEWGDKHVEK